MSDEREPTANNPDGENQASGRRSEQNQPVSDEREPTANNPDGENRASGRRSEQNQPDERAGGHPAVETLADLAEGVRVSRADSVRAHLARCPQCQQRAADLTEVRRVLAAAPAVSMPDEVAARIDAAITAAPEGDAHRVGSHMSARARRPWYQRRPLRIAVAAAAVLVVAVGGVATTRAFLLGNETVSTAGSPGAGDARESASGGEGAPPAAAPLSKSGQSDLDVVTTNKRYSAETVDEQVAALVRSSMAGSLVRASPGTDRAPEALRPLADRERLRNCVTAATGDADGRPLVVDLAQFEGEPAAIIVFAGRDQGRLDVWIVGRACSADRPDVLLRTQASV